MRQITAQRRIARHRQAAHRVRQHNTAQTKLRIHNAWIDAKKGAGITKDHDVGIGTAVERVLQHRAILRCGPALIRGQQHNQKCHGIQQRRDEQNAPKITCKPPLPAAGLRSLVGLVCCHRGPLQGAHLLFIVSEPTASLLSPGILTPQP